MGAPEPLDPAAGIHGETGVPGLDSAQSSHEARACVLIGNAEVHKADLPRHIDPEWSRTGLEFGSKQTGERAQPRGHELRGDPVGEDTGEVALEVVGHFGFQLNVGVDVETSASPDTDEIDVRIRGAKVQIVRKDSYFDMVGALRSDRGRQSQTAT